MSKEVKRYYTTLAFDRPDIAANCSIQGRPATCTSYELTCVVLASDYDALLAERDALIASSAKWKRDSELLDAIEGECWDVRFLSSPNADAGDSSISIEIVGHFMAEPCKRVVGENYSENLRAALEQAMTADAYPPERPEYDERGRPVAALQGAQP